MNVSQRSTGNSTGTNGDSRSVSAFQYTGERDLGVAIVDRIAEHKGIDPDETDGTLYDVIDVDALERLLRNDRSADGNGGGFQLVFEVFEYEVNVRAGGDVVIRAPPT